MSSHYRSNIALPIQIRNYKYFGFPLLDIYFPFWGKDMPRRRVEEINGFQFPGNAPPDKGELLAMLEIN